GTQTIDEGGSFTFTVTPEPCYEIGNVTVNGTAVTLDANNQYTINNITTNQNINVTFNQLTYTITASAGNGGTITPGTTTVNCGESQAYTITPNEGYMISDVTVDGQSVGSVSSYSFTNVTADHTISVTFVEIPDNHIVVVVNADTEGGTVNPTGSQSIEQGSDFTFTVTPDNCYEIGTVTVNGTPVTLEADNTYTITNVTEAQTVNVTFTHTTYTITASAGNGGTITPAGDVDVNCGDNKEFVIVADEGYEIEDVVVDGQSRGAIASYIFENVTEAGHSIEATFRLVEVVVDCNAVTNLTVEPNAYNTTGNLLSWTEVENAESYSVYRNGVLVSTNSATTYFDTEGGQNIEYYVVTNCGNGNTSDPSEIVVSPVTEQCNAVEGLAVSVEPYGNVISWNAAENAVSYNIFRNNETTALANVLSTSYVDMAGNAGDRYYVVTVCQYGESDASDEVEAIPTAIEENSISVELYPNPTDGKFMIECDEMATVEIFNLVGQIVERVEVSSNAITVDASAWTSGVYNVRITTANASIIVKQVVKQ
ncbi:MAG: T9SS type A sorting domain-containing protein, partial [Bacteroidales bacterium]|nr:T9SS type A sorting domain-containing protein [Bacteroidales bacterium]